MSDHKVTAFLIALLVASLFITGIVMFIVETDTKYNYGSNSTTLQGLNKTNDIYEITKEIEDRHKEDVTDRAWYDIVGNLIADGLDSIKLMFASMDTFDDMSTTGTKTVGLPMIFKTILYSIIIIILIVGVFLSAKMKWDL